MKSQFLYLIVFLLIFPVCADAIIFNSQGELDIANIAGHYEGDITIRTTDPADPITDLSPLGELTSIGGYLWISDNDVLTSLDGLSGVTSIGGQRISIIKNSSTIDLTDQRPGINFVEIDGKVLNITKL